MMNAPRFFIRRLPASLPIPIHLMCGLALMLFCAGTARAAELERDFFRPPDAARPPALETYQPEYFEPPKPLDFYRDIAVLAVPADTAAPAR